MLTTDNYPTLDTASSRVQLGNLKIRLLSPLVNKRVSTYAYLSNAESFPSCSYGNWTKAILDTPLCAEEYLLDMPWIEAVNCGFTVDRSTAGFTVYRNNLFVKHRDEVSNFRGTPIYRDTIHTLPIEIKFKTSIQVSTALNVFAPINLLAAITRQTFDPVAGTGTIEFTTSLQWPFELSNATLNGVPVLLDVSLAAATTSCSSTNGAGCQQRYTLTVTPQNSCTLSGTYELGFTILCRGSPTQCPLDASTAIATITGLVTAENFCAALSLDIGLTGVLNVYADPILRIEKSNFLHGQFAYFQATLSTDGTATIVGSEVVEVRVDAGTSSKFLRFGSSLTPDGVSVGLSDMFAVSTPSQPAFQLVPNNDVFVVPVDGISPFTVVAVVDVRYSGDVKKRVLLKRQVQPGVQGAEASAVVTVAAETSLLTNTTEIAPTASASSLASWLALLVVLS